MSRTPPPRATPTTEARGVLRPCPETPNCVGSRETDPAHAMEPLSFEGSADDARKRLVSVLGALPRCRIVADADLVIRAEVTSRIFRFVDDLELVIDPDARQVHFRSAARVGYSDLGANRRRMNRIADAFASLAR